MNQHFMVRILPVILFLSIKNFFSGFPKTLQTPNRKKNPYQLLYDSMKREEEDHALVVQNVETCQKECLGFEKKKVEKECEIEIQITKTEANFRTMNDDSGLNHVTQGTANTQIENESPHYEKINSHAKDGDLLENHVSDYEPATSKKDFEQLNKTGNRTPPLVPMSPIKHKLIKCTDCHQVFFGRKHHTTHMQNIHMKYPLYDGKGKVPRFYPLQKLTLSIKRMKENEGDFLKSTKRISLWENQSPKLILCKEGQNTFKVIKKDHCGFCSLDWGHGSMICCSICSQWWHHLCVGMDEAEKSDPKKYYKCVKCMKTPQKKQKTSTVKKAKFLLSKGNLQCHCCKCNFQTRSDL